VRLVRIGPVKALLYWRAKNFPRIQTTFFVKFAWYLYITLMNIGGFRKTWRWEGLFLLLARWRSWLRHWATSRRFAGSIPNGVIEIFHWHNPSGRAMALGSTRSLTDMRTMGTALGLKMVGTEDYKPCHLGILGASASWSPKDLSRTV